MQRGRRPACEIFTRPELSDQRSSFATDAPARQLHYGPAMRNLSSAPNGFGRGETLPEGVRRTAAAYGAAGLAWLNGLDHLIRGLERDWDVIVGRPLQGGSCAYVAETKTRAGTAVVIKLGIPSHESLANEIRILQAANGRGYVRALNWDVDRNAILLERLGERLSKLNLSIDTQISIICSTLRRAWFSVSDTSGLQTAVGKARGLAAFIANAWDALGKPCSERTIDRALLFANARATAFDPERAVLVHGDPHDANTLQVPGRQPSDEGAFKFIDPDGFQAERAYDLGILMRGWSHELLARDPLRQGIEHAVNLNRLTGVELQPIWQWGLIERVSTGLYALQMAAEHTGLEMLKVADEWTKPGGDSPG
jgi:streptomycin 6-kinase